MPHINAPLSDEVHRQILALARRGVPRWAITSRLNLHRAIIEKWTAHLPDGTKRDLARASIVERIERGDSLDCIASLEGCTPAFVAIIARAWAGELSVRGEVASS